MLPNLISPGLRTCIFCAVCCVYFSISNGEGPIDFSEILGENIDSETAWKRLMQLTDCPEPVTTNAMIIMVNESISAGAEYAGNPSVSSRYECEFQCCNNKQPCNVAVFADKQHHCYLFDCGSPSRCKFDAHDGYTVSILTGDTTSDADKTSKVEVKPATTQSLPQLVSLMGGCRRGVDTCTDTHTHCSDEGFCLCLEGFHPKNGICRKDCLAGLEFECTLGDASYSPPDCIPIYDVCDSTPQCADNSDELKCDSRIETMNFSHSTNQSGSEVGSSGQSQPDLSEKPQDSHEEDLDSLKSGSKVATTAPTTVKQVVDDSPALIEPEKRPNGTLVSFTPSLTDDNPSSGGADPKTTAIIALSVALCLTLIFIVVQYRMMKLKLHRRGKALKGSEVDYLIDGMYL